MLYPTSNTEQRRQQQGCEWQAAVSWAQAVKAFRLDCEIRRMHMGTGGQGIPPLLSDWENARCVRQAAQQLCSLRDQQLDAHYC